MAGSVGQYTQGWFPYAGQKATAGGTFTSQNNSLHFGLGRLQTSGTQNDSFDTDLYLDTGTWKFCQMARADTSQGIQTVYFNGIAQGTIDDYSASGANTYTEITGLVVSPAGNVTLQIKMTSTSAPSAVYYGTFQGLALIRTSGTASTPGGSDTPGYTWEHIPWMGLKSISAGEVRAQDSTNLAGGYIYVPNSITNTWSSDIWLDSGTFKVAYVGGKGPSYAILNHKLDGVSKATMNMYTAAAQTFNNYVEVTGIALTAPTAARTYLVATDDKDPASSAYSFAVQSQAWIRTGA